MCAPDPPKVKQRLQATPVDPSALAARVKQRVQATAALGFASTIATSPGGLRSAATGTPKALLGQ